MAAAAAAVLPPPTAVATKTLAATEMAGATTNNNKLKAVVAMVTKTATMTATMMTMKTKAPGRRQRRMLPSLEDFHHLGSAFVCCPPWKSFMIWDQRSFGREEEDRKIAVTVRERRTMTREQ